MREHNFVEKYAKICKNINTDDLNERTSGDNTVESAQSIIS